MGCFFLKTMGYPELRDERGNVLRFKVRKHLALLIYLCLEKRRAHSRESLIELLWGSVAASKGRHSLSMALSVFRSSLGPHALRSSNSMVTLAGNLITTDIDILVDGSAQSDERRSQLELQGFLSTFDISDSPAFQHWCDRKRATLFPIIQNGVLALIDDARRSGNLARLGVLADLILGMDALSEEGIRAKLEFQALQGDRVGALRLFEAWKERLLTELGAVPPHSLERIAIRLRGRTPSLLPTSSQSRSKTTTASIGTLIGRSREYQTLYRIWQAEPRPEGRNVLITGEIGIGKSALALHFARSVELNDSAIVRVQCFAPEQNIAFGLVASLVTHLINIPGALATSPDALAETARIVPALRRQLPHLPQPHPVRGTDVRLRIAEGVSSLLSAVMDEQPLLLIVDDYQYADEASQGILHFLMRRHAESSLMVVLTAKTNGPPGLGRHSRHLHSLASQHYLQQIELVPLSLPESENMLSEVTTGLERHPTLPVRKAILAAARGNPLALEWLAADWVANGDAAVALSLPAMKHDLPTSAGHAVEYDRVLDRLLPSLSPRVRHVLHMAAVLGTRLRDWDGSDLIGHSTGQVASALATLCDKRILRDVGSGFEFANELIRARLYLKIPQAVRKGLHDRVASRLIALAEKQPGIPLLEIAWHCIRSRRGPEAIPYLLRGAAEAILHGAPDEAVLAIASALGQLRGHERNSANVLLAEAYQEMSQWEESLTTLRDIGNSSEATDPHLGEYATALTIENNRRLGNYSIAQLEQCCAWLTELIENKATAPLPMQIAVIATGVAAALEESALSSGVWNALRRIRPDPGDPLERCKLLLARAHAAYQLRRDDAGLRELLDAARLIEGVGSTDSTFVRVQNALGAVACARGCYNDGLVPLERAFLAARRLDNFPLMCQAAYNRAICLSRMGSPEEHKQWADLALESSQHLAPGAYERLSSAAQLALAGIALGDKRCAEEGLSLVNHEALQTQAPWLSQCAELYKADINWLLGRRRLALEAARRSRNLAAQPLAIGFVGAFVRWSTMLMVHEGKAGEARDELIGYVKMADSLDAKDQAEIYCSMSFIGVREDITMPGIAARADESLSRLPIRFSEELARFGLLRPH